MDEVLISLFQKFPVLSTILAILLAAHALAVVIVNLTPTPADDAVLSKVYAWVEKVAGIVTAKAKDTGLDGEKKE